MPETFTISQVAEQTGISLHTLRYYERIALIEGVERGSSGHRRYSQDDIVWLEFLQRLRATGMPISGMKQFAALRRQGAASLAQRRQMLIRHAENVTDQIATLQDNLEAVRSKIDRLMKQEAQQSKKIKEKR